MPTVSCQSKAHAMLTGGFALVIECAARHRTWANMAGSHRSRAALDKRRRQLLYRSAHRGTREMDILLGGYVAARIASMSDVELAGLERLMDQPDNDMLDWFTGQVEPPHQQVPSCCTAATTRLVAASSPKATST